MTLHAVAYIFDVRRDTDNDLRCVSMSGNLWAGTHRLQEVHAHGRYPLIRPEMATAVAPHCGIGHRSEVDEPTHKINEDRHAVCRSFLFAPAAVEVHNRSPCPACYACTPGYYGADIAAQTGCRIPSLLGFLWPSRKGNQCLICFYNFKIMFSLPESHEFFEQNPSKV